MEIRIGNSIKTNEMYNISVDEMSNIFVLGSERSGKTVLLDKIMSEISRTMTENNTPYKIINLRFKNETERTVNNLCGSKFVIQLKNLMPVEELQKKYTDPSAVVVMEEFLWYDLMQILTHDAFNKYNTVIISAEGVVTELATKIFANTISQLCRNAALREETERIRTFFVLDDYPEKVFGKENAEILQSVYADTADNGISIITAGQNISSVSCDFLANVPLMIVGRTSNCTETDKINTDAETIDFSRLSTGEFWIRSEITKTADIIAV
ncbi:hypothetical protein [Ruminococcus albus]|uniref:Uncharacterized protein n=1 Tax=Ruminococcus albus 8 TaxID=246199 RepID=E9SI46_RUMAL|nr:hypothetical protein [Ruminococcus albus]EGC01040.1 hypothetical protein CUS_4495 [Ruminococcus albus 8]MCC3351842.1 hypothetical protein [Ruminococcus albus 8]